MSKEQDDKRSTLVDCTKAISTVKAVLMDMHRVSTETVSEQRARGVQAAEITDPDSKQSEKLAAAIAGCAHLRDLVREAFAAANIRSL